MVTRNDLTDKAGLTMRLWRHIAICLHGPSCTECCWPWTAGRSPQGYGKISASTPRGKAHLRVNRALWMLIHGDIPAGLFVCHTCDNPPCANPAHYWLGTIQDNNRDSSTKGRHPKGAGHHLAKLTDEQVTDIRYLAACGMPYKLLGFIYQVSSSLIGCIHRGEIWRHLLPAEEVR
jgi:Pectobacterium phage endonuclease